MMLLVLVILMMLVVLIIVGVDSIMGSVGVVVIVVVVMGCLLLVMVVVMVKASPYSEIQSGQLPTALGRVYLNSRLIMVPLASLSVSDYNRTRVV